MKAFYFSLVFMFISFNLTISNELKELRYEQYKYWLEGCINNRNIEVSKELKEVIIYLQLLGFNTEDFSPLTSETIWLSLNLTPKPTNPFLKQYFMITEKIETANSEEEKLINIEELVKLENFLEQEEEANVERITHLLVKFNQQYPQYDLTIQRENFFYKLSFFDSEVMKNFANFLKEIYLFN